MIHSGAMTSGLATEVARPSGRTGSLPGGTSVGDRDALLQVIAECLLEIRAWPAASEIGDSSHLILDTHVGGASLYAQFISEPGERGLLCEVASGFYGDAAAYRPTPDQRRAMVSRGFSDGLAGNFQADLVFDAPDAARSIAEQTLNILGSVFGWIPASRITATVHHGRRVEPEIVFNGLSPGDVIELLTRSGLEASRSGGPSSARAKGTTVDSAVGGRLFTMSFADSVAGTSRFRTVTARARVGSGIDAAATNPFNALTSTGRNWVQDGEPLSLLPVHFDVGFHMMQRMARCHVKPAAEEAALAAFRHSLRSASAAGADDTPAWTFFESHVAAHPEVAAPREVTFVATASATEIVPWLERLDGVGPVVTPSGDLEVSHAVAAGALLVVPSQVRSLAFSRERFALCITIDRGNGPVEIVVDTDGFDFHPEEARIEIDGVTFVVADMAATVGWFETRQRLRALEREMAWAGALGCGGAIAWMNGALAGAERAGLACGEERVRFDAILAAARRSLAAARRERSAEAPPSS